ncbi:trimeric intracellular cation channel family protein [Mucilaginibacter sp. KACC 22063]|uniref:trimeric intracellular cation channel family protein n=1 Tax=Mucilaginibacter sp. KACC 22063 TaxID=3025666 RepID=UPI002365F1F7|nr:trimeric intracellular cation channel family protein [Mucilaginibacter sp. KACC 22063]WDF54750.1 trimeric intracellular cation channel family protein [Mucilaginibacter sp. KACC 22063]
MTLNVSTIIEILGTVAFTISGVFSAMQKRLDALGVVIIGFITAIGGGTIRDVLIGYTPVSWMRNIDTPLIILVTAFVTILFKKHIKSFKVTLFLCDALGLGLFTIIGIQRGLNVGLHPGICVALGTITGCFGGVIRDISLNAIPMIFRRQEIYATACIIGGSIYILMLHVIDPNIAKLIAVAIVCSIRILAVRYKIKLPVG